MDLGTILGVWAHPDDEAYLSGGIMAQSVHDGRRVVCVTATRGEAGSWDHTRWPPDELGAIREAELNDSLTIWVSTSITGWTTRTGAAPKSTLFRPPPRSPRSCRPFARTQC
jgi:LmbE family N-acetylglucosaminyl deacetylase